LYDKVDYGVYIDLEEAKKDINMVIIGHVDAGKSTLMGHLLFKMGKIDAHKIKKNAKMAEEYGKATFEFAYVMDEDEEERRRGITINTA
jgi:translation elongation factor EF-1alpha